MSSAKVRKQKVKRDMLKKRCLTAVGLVTRKSTNNPNATSDKIEQTKVSLDVETECKEPTLNTGTESNKSSNTVEENDPKSEDMELCNGNCKITEDDISNLLSQIKELPVCNKSTRHESCGTSSNNSAFVVHTDHSYLTSGFIAGSSSPIKTSSCSSIPDAELMQDFFLHTTNMISYQPIAEAESLPPQRKATTLIGWDQTLPIAKIPDACDSLDNSDVKADNIKEEDTFASPTNDNDDDGNNSKMCTKSEDIDDIDAILDSINAVLAEGPDGVPCPETPSTSSMSDIELEPPIKQCKLDEEPENDRLMNDLQEGQKQTWMTACRTVSEQVQQDVIVDCAFSLMTQMWTDYLNLTFDDLRQREIESARELDLCDEVVEMLEDKDRYIWQLIEEMEPTNFSTEMDQFVI